MNKYFCNNCGNIKFEIVESGPHKKLICGNCGAYIAFINTKYVSNSDRPSMGICKVDDRISQFNSIDNHIANINSVDDRISKMNNIDNGGLPWND